MQKTKWDLCGDEATIDLFALKSVLEQAVANAKNELQRQEREIQDHFEVAFRSKFDKTNKLGKYNGDEYSALCAANTHREWLVNAAIAYSDAIQAYFHIVEAIKRDEIKIYRGSDPDESLLLGLNKYVVEKIQGE